MAQVTTGIRSILSIPQVYDLVQRIMGAHSGRKNLVSCMRVHPGQRVLDIGCGTAEILSYLPDVKY